MHLTLLQLVLSFLLCLCSFGTNSQKMQGIESSIFIQKILRIQRQSPVSSNEEDFSWIDNVFKGIAEAEDQKNNELTWGEFEGKDGVNQFGWKDCSTGSTPRVRVTSFTVSPVPIRKDGTVSISFAADVTGNIDSPLQAEVSVSKKIGLVYVHVRTENVPQICEKLSGKTCPEYFHHCHCPFEAGSYTMPVTEVDARSVLHQVPSGDYHVTTKLLQDNRAFNVTKNGNSVKEVGCIYVELSIK